MGALAWGQTFPVLQGATNSTSSQFVIMVPAGTTTALTIEPETGPSLRPTWVTEVTNDEAPSAWKLVKFKIDGLRLGLKYTLKIETSDGQTDERVFRALDPDLRFPKIAVTSCMVDWLHNAAAWQQMQSLSPDMIVIVGDTTYVDIASPKDLLFRPDKEKVNHWERFASTRDTLDVFRWKELKPILALPDDHDFGYDNVNSSFGLKKQANRTFSAFFGQAGDDFIFERGPGNSFKADLFGYSFVFLDGRNFRINGSMMMSPEQFKWIEGLQLLPHSFAITGSQFFGKYLKKDSFEGNFARNFEGLLNSIRKMNSRFSFISGDVHFSEVMRIEKEVLGYETFEITSSSIHSFTIAGGHAFRPYNPRRVPGLVTSTHNFQTMEWDSLLMDTVTVRAHGWRGQNLFEGQLPIPGRTLEVSEDASEVSGSAAGCEKNLL